MATTTTTTTPPSGIGLFVREINIYGHDILNKIT